jgi:hypothetical protein
MHTNACTAGGGRPQHDILVFRGGKVVWNALEKNVDFQILGVVLSSFSDLQNCFSKT